MAENTVLSALRNPKMAVVGDFFADQLFVDFTGASHTPSGDADTAYNLTSGDYFKAFNLPQGAVITEAGWVCHTTDTCHFVGTTVDGTSTGGDVVADAAVGSQYAAVCTHDTTPIIQATGDGYFKLTGATADADTAVVTFFIKGFVVKRQS